MAKYDSLKHFLAVQHGPALLLGFDEIAGIVDGLPPSAFELHEWWANTTSHVQANAWLDSGWVVDEVDLAQERVSFVVDGGEATSGPGDGEPPRGPWSESEFFAELERNDPGALTVANDLYRWLLEEESLEVSFGSGRKTGSVIAWTWLDDVDGDWIPVFAFWTNGKLNGTWRYRPKFDGADFWVPYVEEVARIGGIPQTIQKSRSIEMASLESDAAARLKRAVLNVIAAAAQASRGS